MAEPKLRMYSDTLRDVVDRMDALHPDAMMDAAYRFNVARLICSRDAGTLCAEDWPHGGAKPRLPWEQPCGGCGGKRGALVQVGEDEGYDTQTAHLCEACVRKALALFEVSDG